MKNIEIRQLGDYINLFNSLEGTEFYRGVADSNFKLIPSIGRYAFDSAERRLQVEKDLLNEFKRKAPMYTQALPHNDLEWLYMAQHHGLPTRLMDWSFNPLVALHFAVENERETDAAVYCAYPSSGFVPSPHAEHPQGIFNSERQAYHLVPTRNHVRFQNQDGLFTLHPDPSQNNIKNIVTKVIIPKSAKEAIRWKLRKIGITKSFLFGNLDGLSYDIKQIVLRRNVINKPW